jgi:mRNA interferase MazF
VIIRGDIWWTDLGDPIGAVAGYHRPVIIIQADAINRSRLETVLCVPLTSNLSRAQLPTNLLLKSSSSGLDRDCVAQTTLLLAVDKIRLAQRVGVISPQKLEQLYRCLDTALGR